MTLEELKQSASDMTNFGEHQFIVQSNGELKLLTKYYGMGHPEFIDKNKVVAHRSFLATAYSKNHQSDWFDYE